MNLITNVYGTYRPAVQNKTILGSFGATSGTKKGVLHVHVQDKGYYMGFINPNNPLYKGLLNISTSIIYHTLLILLIVL